MKAQAWKVQSKSNPETIYIVSQDPVTGELTCNCKGFEYRKRCAHSAKVSQLLLDKKGDKHEQKHKN